MESIKLFLAALWVTGLLWVCGAAVHSWIAKQEGLERDLAVTMGWGYVCLTTIFVMLGFAGHMRPLSLIVVTLLILLLLSAKTVRTCMVETIRDANDLAKNEWRTAHLLIKWGVALFLFLSLVKTLAPSTHGDAFAVYLNFPKFQSLSGRLWSDIPLRGNFSMTHSHVVNAIGFLAGETLGASSFSNMLPRLLTGLLPVWLSCLLILRMAKTLFPARSHLLPVLLFLSIDAVLTMAYDGKSFTFSLLFEMLFIYSWMKAMDTQKRPDFFKALFLLSFGLAILPQLYFNVPLLPILIFGTAIKLNKSWPNRLKWGASLVLCGIPLVFLYQGLYSQIYSHLMQKPLTMDFIPTAGSLGHYHAKTFFHGVGGFFELLFKYSVYKEAVPLTGQNFGPLLLMFAIPSLLVWRRANNITHKTFFLFFIAYFAEFYFFKQTARHALLALVGLSLPASLLFESVTQKTYPPWIRKTITASIGLILMLMFLRGVQHSLWRKHFHYLLSRQTLEDFIARVHPHLGYAFLPDGRLEAFLRDNIKEQEQFLVYGPLPKMIYLHQLPLRFNHPPAGRFLDYLKNNNVRYIILKGDTDPYLDQQFPGDVSLAKIISLGKTFPVGGYRGVKIEFTKG